MGIQKKIAEVMQMIKDERNLSLTEFAKELQISRSSLQEYLKGNANPRADTIDQIADRLSIDPVVFVSGIFTTNQIKIIHLLLNTVNELSSLAPEQRQQFAELFSKMISLWSDTEDVSSNGGK